MNQQHSLKKTAWVMLGIGFAAFLFSSGRWNCGVTAWIWPFAFLYFSRQTKTKKQFLLLAAAIAAGHVLKWLNVMDSGYWLDAAFCLFWSVFWILPFLADRLLAKKLPGAFLSSLIFPTVFVSLEALRTLTPLGSLGAMAYTQSGFLPLVQVTSLIGSFGLSFLIFWFGSAVVTVLEKRQGRKAAAGVCFALLIVSVCFGCVRLAAFPIPSENAVRVASIVGPYYEKYKDGTYEEIPTEESLRYFLREAQRAADGGARIACWNEEAFTLDDTDEPLLLDAAAAFAKAHDMILIVGYELTDTDGGENGDAVNKSVFLQPDGTVTGYVKTHLIPVVEVPGYVKGSGNVPSVATAHGDISNVICFDDTFIGFIREKTGSADILFVPSWDWKPIARAHTELSEFRAVENGFALVKPTYDGISTAVDGQGRVIRRFDTIDTGFNTVQFADVPAQSVPTVYGRIGSITDLVFFLSGFITVAFGLVKLRKKEVFS
jgi:apolipoprotein N-acyltransferase